MKTALLKRQAPETSPGLSLHSALPHQHPLTELTGADIFFLTLLEHGIDIVFGYPGGKVLGLYDRLLEYPEIRHILVSHEQGGSHAADGYARVSGKPGVMITTSGPGATNTVTGLANAQMDSIPLVVFSGQVEVPLLGKQSFQESNIIEITRPITKWNHQVKNVDELQDVVSKALTVAVSGKPGPVLIDIPKNFFQETAFFRKTSSVPSYKSPPMDILQDQHLQQATELINKAQKPVIYAGGGIVLGKAWDELRRFAAKTRIPVTTTLMALGAFPSDHELSLGMLGMHGTWQANMAVQECDLLIALGARFDDRVTSEVSGFSPRSKKIHVDIDPDCINKNVNVDVPIVGDVRTVLSKLEQAVDMQAKASWLKQVSRWKEKHALSYDRNSRMIKPQAVIEKLSRLTQGNAVVVTDVGQHQMWTALHYSFKAPRAFVTSGGLGTMGFGLPAAIGASVAAPNSTVLCICGDGGLRMTASELSTAAANRVPIKIIVINNGCLGMVRQWQSFFFEDRYAHSILTQTNPDFIRMADSYGVLALRAVKPEELDFVLKKAMDINDRPVLVECLVDPSENVYPMVSPGADLDNMVVA